MCHKSGYYSPAAYLGHQVRSQFSPCRICSLQSDCGAGFAVSALVLSCSFQDFLCSYFVQLLRKPSIISVWSTSKSPRGCFDSWKREHHGASKCRCRITHWRSVISQKIKPRHIHSPSLLFLNALSSVISIDTKVHSENRIQGTFHTEREFS